MRPPVSLELRSIFLPPSSQRPAGTMKTAFYSADGEPQGFGDLDLRKIVPVTHHDGSPVCTIKGLEQAVQLLPVLPLDGFSFWIRRSRVGQFDDRTLIVFGINGKDGKFTLPS